MLKKLFFSCIILLVLSNVSFAEIAIDTYIENVDVTKENSFHDIDMIMSFKGEQEFTIIIPPRAKNLQVFLDKDIIQCSLSEGSGSSQVTCASPALVGKHSIRMIFETNYPVILLKNQVMYKSEFISRYNISKFNYILKLPEGYRVPKEKDISFYLSPKPESIFSDGQRIIVFWEEGNLSNSFGMTAIFEQSMSQSNIPLIVIMISTLILLVVLAIAFYHIKSEHNSKKSGKWEPHALIKDEEKIVSVLKEGNNELWQKQIQIKTGFTKVKISRVLRSLEERGVIKKEPYGNTNKISLIKNEEKQN